MAEARNLTVIAALLLSISMLAQNASASARDEVAIVTAFSEFCGRGDFAAGDVLAKADAAGWEHTGIGLPADFDLATDRFYPTAQGVLLLRLTHNASAGEQRYGCGIIASYPQPNLVAATGDYLGAKPQANFGPSADFFVVRTDVGWISASQLDAAALKEAKDQGRYFSIVALGSDHNATLFALQVRADPPLRRHQLSTSEPQSTTAFHPVPTFAASAVRPSRDSIPAGSALCYYDAMQVIRT